MLKSSGGNMQKENGISTKNVVKFLNGKEVGSLNNEWREQETMRPNRKNNKGEKLCVHKDQSVQAIQMAKIWMS